jgi:hypothetical protein
MNGGRPSVASDGTQANYEFAISAPAISADGSYVAFVSEATNLVADDTNGCADVFVNERLTGMTTRVSVASDGTQANEASWSLSMSADGRYVAFSPNATNLVTGDTNQAGDVFVRDRHTDTTSRVSIASDGSQSAWQRYSTMPSMSADGRYVAFESEASNLVPKDTNGREDVFVAVSPVWVSCSITCSPTSPVRGEPALFQADCTQSGATAYEWAFGSADLAPGQTVTHTFTTAEPYRVCLTVTYPDDYPRTTCQMVEVQEPPAEPECVTNDYEVCLPVAGWHLVAQPHGGTQSLGFCQIRNNATGQTLWFAEAAVLPYTWVQGTLFRWDPILTGYQLCSPSPDLGETSLLWGHGYWLYTYVDNLTLIVP